ncbi:MAG: aspartate/glutamate racemase family protein [Ignisphaera sp.]|nr:aspartate/glutamate racemase family protein [Ignisphaera sp.]MDW8084822.1 aspartate/glutamate racemase family protein [Ignisphaera sp.]
MASGYRLLIINPVSTSEWNEHVLRFARAVLPEDVEVVVKSLPGAPPAIECEYDRDLAAPHVIGEVVKANREGFNAVIINCFDDPGLEASREISEIPVLGIGETSMVVALLLGYRIAVVSTGRNSVVAYYRRAVALGIEKRIIYTSGIEVPVLSIRRDVGRVRELLLSEIRRAVESYGAEVVVLGCGGFIGLAEELSRVSGVPVVDPTIVTLKMAESIVRLGLKHSKIYLFNRLTKPY